MHIYLEITNSCNRKCSFCPGTTRPPLFVTPERFEERLKKVLPLADLVSMHLLGEPLFHPHFPEILAIGSRLKAPLQLTTNGTLLAHHKDLLLSEEHTLRQINFSLQALDPVKERKLLENILFFCLESVERRPEMYINLRLWNLPEDFSANAKNRFVYMLLQKFFPDFPLDPEFSPGRKSKKITGRLYLHSDSLFHWPGDPAQTASKVLTASSLPVPGKCRGLLDQCGVLADGTLVPCCLDADGRIDLGNLDLASSLEELLTSPRANRMRESLQRGLLIEDLCKNCSYCKRFNRE